MYIKIKSTDTPVSYIYDMIKLKIKVHTIRILHTDAQTHKLTSRAFLKKEVKIQTSNYTKLNSQ